jgi:hypothetical protein
VKKVTSISFVLLMLTAMLHLTIATHYCGGKIAASKVSLTDKLANCGMESSEKGIPILGTNFSTHCCDDVVILCGIDSNYEPSFSFVPESYQYNFQVFTHPLGLSVNSISNIIPSYTYIYPPGTLMFTNVDLSDICVLRI